MSYPRAYTPAWEWLLAPLLLPVTIIAVAIWIVRGEG